MPRGVKGENLTGQMFGHFTVLCEALAKNGQSRWHCQCECGKVKPITTRNLKSGNSRSCGCHRGDSKVVHGMTGTAVYRVWQKHVHKLQDFPKEWRKFEDFYEFIGDKPTPSHELSRRDNRKPHGKENTYWRAFDNTEHKARTGNIDLRNRTYSTAGEAED